MTRMSSSWTLSAGKTYDISMLPKGLGWENFSAPFVSIVEDVGASTETSFPYASAASMRNFSFTAATTGIHRFTVEGHTFADQYFACGEYTLTVAEHIPAPQAPKNLTVSSQTDDSVTLTWEAPEGSVVESYQILRRSRDDQKYGDNHGASSFVVIVDDTGSADTTYTDISVEPSTRYVYRVKARNTTGLSERSNYANAETLPPNSAATGAPVITGSTKVDQTLTADVTGIEDADGLNDVTYSYQWLADDAIIAGATGAGYTLTASEEGKAIKVRVTFTDDAGNDESLVSAATTAVEPAG